MLLIILQLPQLYLWLGRQYFTLSVPSYADKNALVAPMQRPARGTALPAMHAPIKMRTKKNNRKDRLSRLRRPIFYALPKQ